MPVTRALLLLVILLSRHSPVTQGPLNTSFMWEKFRLPRQSGGGQARRFAKLSLPRRGSAPPRWGATAPYSPVRKNFFHASGKEMCSVTSMFYRFPFDLKLVTGPRVCFVRENAWQLLQMNCAVWQVPVVLAVYRTLFTRKSATARVVCIPETSQVEAEPRGFCV